MLACPRCTLPLRPELLGEVTIDRCPGCRGVWLDKGEAEPATRPVPVVPGSATASSRHLRAEEPSEARVAKPVDCPACKARMRRERYPRTFVDLDRCACGVWLDLGELDKLRAHRRRRREELSGQLSGADPTVLERIEAQRVFGS